jgi:hypothetical protein
MRRLLLQGVAIVKIGKQITTRECPAPQQLQRH